MKEELMRLFMGETSPAQPQVILPANGLRATAEGWAELVCLHKRRITIAQSINHTGFLLSSAVY